MGKYAVEVFAAFVDHRSKADDFGACADDYQEFEATVVLEGNVAVVGFKFHITLLVRSKYLVCQD